ncbi:hypothetical protein [Phytoactinopolyspora endophytica]|uniref:hypothetical protein n=1 Tax=Phytoactinopolyspora endophytica TaxID=1642495 RepID=UPI00101DA1DB|nr:hypothetical protein [Phytoactinopolyspora endophytica]
MSRQGAAGQGLSGQDATGQSLTGQGWWHRNRWGLVALPFVLAAALVAASYQVEEQWWLARPREAVDAGQGVWVDFIDTRYDRGGDVPIEVAVRLVGLEEATEPFGGAGESIQLPPGTRGVAVVLDLTAAPDVPLVGCRLSVIGADGTEYAYQYASPSISQATSPCVPPDNPGPDLELFEGTAGPDDGSDSDSRPEQFSVAPVVVVPADTEIVEVRLAWGAPRYVAFHVSS